MDQTLILDLIGYVVIWFTRCKCLALDAQISQITQNDWVWVFYLSYLDRSRYL